MIEIKESLPSSGDCLLWPFHQLELLVLFLLSAKSFLRDRILSTTALCVSSLEGRNKSSDLTGACKSDENPSMKMSPSLAQADKSWYFCFLVAVLWPFTRIRKGSIRGTSNTESVLSSSTLHSSSSWPDSYSSNWSGCFDLESKNQDCCRENPPSL